MEYRAFKLFSDKDISRISLFTEDVLSQWADSWFVNDISYSVEKSIDRVLVDEAVMDNWSIGILEDNNALIALYQSNNAEQASAACMSGINSDKENQNISTTLIHKLFKCAINDLLVKLLHLYGYQDTSINYSQKINAFQRRIKSYCAGLIVFRVNVAGEDILVVLDWEILKTKMKSNEKKNTSIELTPAISAFGDSKVNIDVYLGEASLEVENLSRLDVGNVIKLDLLYDQPAKLYINNNYLCDGVIGCANGNKAIKIQK